MTGLGRLACGVALLAATILGGFAPEAQAAVTKLPKDADYNRAIELYRSILAERAPALMAPPVDFSDVDGAGCEAASLPRTHAILVGTTDLGMGNRFLMKGTTNDVMLLRGMLENKGVAAERIHVLLDGDATRPGVFDTFRTVLKDVRCNDRVIVHFSTHATPQSGFANMLLTQAGDDSSDPAVQYLAGQDLMAQVFRKLRSSRLERGVAGEFGELTEAAAGLQMALEDDLVILLTDDSPTYHELMRGRDVSDFMVAVRNAGGHAIVSLDVLGSASARIEQRQKAAGDVSSWSFQYETPGAEYWPSPELAPGHGSYTVFYATDMEEVTPELRLPRDAAPDMQKIYGLFTFIVGSELIENSYATPRSIAAAVQRAYSAEGRSQPRPIVVSSEPDLVLIAEVAPQSSDPIKILSPKPTRGAMPIERAEVEIKGSIDWNAPVLGVMVDGADAALSADGTFSHVAALKPGMNNLNIVAVTADSRLHKKTLELLFEGDKKALEGEGKRLAVIIANQTYGQASGMPNLATPFADADALAAVLKDRYGFAMELDTGGKVQSLILKDPTKRQIETTLHQLGKAAGAKDTVLIFYAGHGVFEPITNSAYWVPSDAEQGFEPSYLSAADISAAIQRIQANHVILISDSCYSGALLRGGGDAAGQSAGDGQRMQALLKLQSRKSRIVITSGNNEPVEDLGGDGHSVFARALLTGLEKMDHDAFSARELFDGYILQQVTANADQEPQYRPLEKVGHEGGDFVFVKSAAATAQSAE